MYGLRDAAHIWPKVVTNMLEARGYAALEGTQCTYINKTTGLVIVAHVDDFLVMGGEDELFQSISDLQKDFECTGQVFGYGSHCVQELNLLGRTISLTPVGIEWEGDRKHVDSFL